MSMTVARRNRVWTATLRTQFVKDVEALRNSMPKMSAFAEAGQKWGLSPNSAMTNFYAFRVGKNPTSWSKKNPPNRFAPRTSLKDENAVDLQTAITLLKKMGATITF